MDKNIAIGNKWKIKGLTERLRSKGLAVTKQRMAILDYVTTHENHPTVESIHSDLSRQYGSLSKTTIYNTLKQFADCGIIRLIHNNESICADCITEPHGHFICTRCGGVTNVPYVHIPNIDSLLKGYDIQEAQQYYRGICEACKKKQEYDYIT